MGKRKQAATPEEARRLAKAAEWMRARRAKARAAVWNALDEEGRRELLARRSAARREACRRGWVTRRKNAGMPPGPAERTRVVHVYRRDLAEAARYDPDPKRGLRMMLEGLALAVEAGAVVWTGEGWRLGDGPWKALGGAGAVEGRQPCPEAERTQQGATHGRGGAVSLDGGAGAVVEFQA